MEAFFLPAASGQRFCLLHTPPAGQPTRGGLVYIHPFAEELNRSRRMATLQARAFANAGYAVLQMDLHGCGDSAGDFANASWESWVSDVTLARQWLADRLNCREDALWLWGLRVGCLLVAELASRSSDPAGNLLLWQPVLSGLQHLNQFLRLKMAADLVQGKRSSGTEAWARQLATGQPVEVAGYALSPALAQGLALAKLGNISPASRVLCFEVAGTASASLSPALSAQLVRWQTAGCAATGQSIEGPLFWQTVESELCPALIDASLAAVLGGAN